MAAPAGMKETTVKRGPEWPLTVAVYVVLFVFGAVQALVGSFQYSRVSGPVPVAALACCAAILATCVLAAWATRSVSGALLPGIAWVLTSFVLSMPVTNGSVIITNTTAGKVYLYGGTLCVVAGVLASFAGLARWSRRAGGA
jgi:hypothetical protein